MLLHHQDVCRALKNQQPVVVAMQGASYGFLRDQAKGAWRSLKCRFGSVWCRWERLTTVRA